MSNRVSLDASRASGSLLFFMAFVVAVLAATARADERPNILWITSEDNSPLLGCYGDDQAHTPNLDRLAREGVRYRNAFANAPVCSAARSTLLSGSSLENVSRIGIALVSPRTPNALIAPDWIRSFG